MSGIMNMFVATKTTIATAVDAFFNSVSLLLNTTATNGAQNNTFLDSSTNNFSITRNGNTTQGTFTPFSQTGWSNYGNGATVDGLTSATSAAYSFGTGDWSVELWFFRAGDGGSAGFLEAFIDMRDSDVTGNGVVIGTKNDGSIRAYDSGLTTAAGTFTNNTWTHLVYTRQSGAIRIFLNGVMQAYNGSYTTNYTNTNCRVLRNLVSGYGFNGYTSNVRVIKGSVPSLYQTSATSTGTSVFTPPIAPLTAISGTSLLTAQSNRFVDNSSNNFALTTSGTPSVQAFSPFLPTAAYDAAVVGGSGYFDGTGDSLTWTGTAAGSGAFSYEFWLYSLNDFSVNRQPLGVISTSGYNSALDVRMSGTTINMSAYNVANNNFTVPALVANTWYHVVLCRNSSNQATVFLNGVRSSTGAVTLATNFSGLTSCIGAQDAVSAGERVTGYISDIRLIVGSTPYDPTASTITVPTAPLTAITNTQFLPKFTNAGIYDSAAKNVLETVGNAQVSTTQAKWGTTAMYFDGSSSYLKPPSSINLSVGSGNFTYEFWLYAGTNSDNCLFDTRTVNNTTSGFAFLIRSSVNLFVYTTANDLTCNNAITANTWQHVALVRNGSTLTAYVNGTSVGSTTFSNNLTDQTISIASYVGGGGYLNGYMDDFRLTKGYARYTANFTAPTAPFPIQ